MNIPLKKRVFVENCGPLAKEAGELFELNPIVILAQGALESGWGESVLAREHHNYFGICGYGRANPYWPGRTVQLELDGPEFRAYPEPLLSFLDYGRLIRAAYKPAAAMSFHPEAFAKEIAYSKYISEVNGDNREAYREALVKLCKELEVIYYEVHGKKEWRA